MVKVKHFLDDIEADDGVRIWVEPIGLVKEFQDMCEVDHTFIHLGPPTPLWEWFEQHPDGYDYFRAQYHDHLAASPYRNGLQELAVSAQRENFTLLHQGDNPDENSAAALHDFISELEAYIPNDEM